MNYRQGSQQIAQSNAIFKKLEQIRSAIDGPTLNDYLPKQRLNSSYNQRNSESYRRSLEKRLQRMFKEERKGFIQNQNESSYSIHPQAVPNDQNVRINALTADRMQQKIRQLEKKYKMNKAPQQNHNETKSRPKIHSMQQTKQQNNSSSPKRKQKSPKTIEHSPERQRTTKIYSQIKTLKKQIKEIKLKNHELEFKFENKTAKRKEKQKSKLMLRDILTKLTKIQTQIEIKEKIDKKQFKSRSIRSPFTHQEQYRKDEETRGLKKLIEQLTVKLNKEKAQKEMAVEKNRWIQEQLRKINDS